MRPRWVVILIAAVGCGTTAPRATIAPASTTRVLASRREVRLVFTTDSGRVWGWPARDDSSDATAFAWGANVDGLDGPRATSLSVAARGHAARRFASLRELVAAGSAAICAPGMIQVCKPGIAARVEGSHIVLSLRDPRLIAQLFAMRPAVLRVWRPATGLGRFLFDSVTVEYVAPMIPEPDSTLRAEAARRRRTYESGVSWVGRAISLNVAFDHALAWLAVGDSVQLHVSESRCSYDVCARMTIEPPRPRWAVDDSSIAGLGVKPPATEVRRIMIDSRDSVRYVIGRAPGRTTLRVRFGALPSDALPSRTPPAHELEQNILVTLPIRRVTIQPRLASVQVGQRVEFALVATDASGAELTGLPAQLVVDGGAYKYAGSGRMPVVFDRPGAWSVIGRLGQHADSIRVTVTP